MKSMRKRMTALALALAALALSVFAAEPGGQSGEQDKDAPLRFDSLESRIRENNLQILTLEQQIAALEDVDYEDMEQDLRDELNAIGNAQGLLVDLGQTGTYAYDKLSDTYSALRQQFDAIRNGDLQEDQAGVIRQLRNVQDQIVLGGEAMYLALLSMESQEESLERQLTALDRTLAELRLRHELGQISTLTLTEAEAGRASLESGLETLRMNIRVYTAQLAVLLGEEPEAPLRLAGASRVTAAQLDAMDPVKDLEAAKSASYELYDAQKTFDKTRDAYNGLGSYTPSLEYKYGWPAAQYTYQNAVRSYELKFRSLYAQVGDYRQVLEAAKVTLESKQASCQASELKYQQGTISKNALLTAREEVSDAGAAVQNAENNLFTAWNNYRWAVEKGILN